MEFGVSAGARCFCLCLCWVDKAFYLAFHYGVAEIFCDITAGTLAVLMTQRWVGEQFQTCKSYFFVIMRYNECARVGIKTFRSYLSSDNATSGGHCLKHFVLYA